MGVISNNSLHAGFNSLKAVSIKLVYTKLYYIELSYFRTVLDIMLKY